MAADPFAPELTIWSDARRAPLVIDLLARLGPAVRPIGVGGARSAEVSELARELGAPVEDDFRKLLVDYPAAYVLLASAGGVAREDLNVALAAGSTVLTLEPAAMALEDLPAVRARPMMSPGTSDGDAAPAAPKAPGRLVFAPAFLRSPGWTSAANPEDVVGACRLIGFTSFGPPDDRSLYSRLYDAWQVVLTLAALPETIDASLITPLPQLPENPREMTGHLALHARIATGTTAVMQVSDRVGRAIRQLRAVGEQGQIVAGELGYRLYDLLGTALDQKEPADDPAPTAVLVAEHWRRLLGSAGMGAAPPGPEEAQVLACCLATLLSARTGQPESPQKLLALNRR